MNNSIAFSQTLRATSAVQGSPTSANSASAEAGLDGHGRVGETIRSLAYGEMLISHLLGAGLHLAPTIDDKIVLGEEMVCHLGNVEGLAALHERMGEGDLLAVVGKRVRDLPAPHSWGELMIARLLFSAATRAQLSRSHGSTNIGLVDAVVRMSAKEAENGAVAEATLRDFFRGRGIRSVDARADVERWWRVVLRLFDESAVFFGRRGTGGRPVRTDHAEVVRAYVSSVLPVFSACGLRPPAEVARAATVA